MLESAGHVVTDAIVTGGGQRGLPGFFAEAFEPITHRLDGPALAVVNDKGISAARTMANLIRGWRRYRKSLFEIAGIVRRARPDLILNFYEPLTGWVKRRCGTSMAPTLAIGHQFMVEHPAFVRMRKFRVQQRAMRGINWAVAGGGPKAALSFYAVADQPERKLFVCPPLLRREVLATPSDSKGSAVLVYLLNRGYCENILDWHRDHPETPVDCFSDFAEPFRARSTSPNLRFHALDGTKFLRLMGACRAVVCTAGFESVCEAASLGKPTLVVPVENHAEQQLNALDAHKARVAVVSDQFDLGAAIDCRVDPAVSDQARAWFAQAPTRFVRLVERVAGGTVASASAIAPA
jgi:uncharacterized protein (TIGR00661 family)